MKTETQIAIKNLIFRLVILDIALASFAGFMIMVGIIK